VSDDDDGKLDYLAKYRGGEEEHVEDAQMLTIVSSDPKQIEGNAYNHISFAYSLLHRVDYFDGRLDGRKGEETLQLTFLNGRVVIRGVFLEKLHRRILRREVEVIREALRMTDKELEAIKRSKEQNCTITAAIVFVPRDDEEVEAPPVSSNGLEAFEELERDASEEK
jgi:hypothetical protein